MLQKSITHVTTTVSAKIPDDLKSELDEEGVNVSEVIREALEAEIRKRRREELRERVRELRSSVEQPPTPDEITDIVRADREER